MTKEEWKFNLTLETPCDFEFCKKLYGYGYYDPEFIQSVLDEFDSMGRPLVKYIFGLYLKTELEIEAGILKEAGKDMPAKIDKEYERMVEANKCLMKQKKLTKSEVARQILNW